LIVQETADSITCRLPDGEVSTIPKHPKRTVILLTSLLDLWSEAGGEVVGRCAGKMNVPPEALNAPIVGTFNNPNVEKIIAARPDLVISSDVGNFRAIIPILKQNHIPYAYFSYVNYYDYIHILELFSKLNATEDEFKAAYQKMTGKVNDIVDRCKKYAPPKVLIVFTTSNAVSCELPNSQTGVMLSMLGARNIIPAKYHVKSKTRINFSLERIVELNPDIILLNTMGDVKECRMRLKKEFEMNAAWSALQAIQKGRFYVLPKHYFLFKPNDAFPEALRYLAAILYPEFAAGSNAQAQTTTLSDS
jgi:iron complex transport system substrate-binding protein